MDIRDLRYFCVTAELEHVTKAAEQLGVSQPFLTRIIGQLEKEIGVPLFDNVGRKIRLNQCGITFYGLAKRALAEFDNVTIEMDKLLDRHEQTITFLADSEGYSSEIAVRYKLAYPNSRLTISYAPRKDIIDALISGTADFGLCTPPILDAPNYSLVTETVFYDTAVILLPPNSPLLEKTSLTFDDLRGEPLVSSMKDSGMRNNQAMVFEKYDFHPQTACETNDAELLVKMVMSGLGYAMMPRSNMLQDERLRKFCRPLDVPENVAVIGISYNKNTSVGKDVEGFLEFIRDFFREWEESTEKSAEGQA